MTPEEQQIIASYASIIYNNIISTVLVSMTGFGVSILGMIIAAHILVYEISKLLSGFRAQMSVESWLLSRNKPWTHPQNTLLTCLIMAFIASTSTIIADVALPLIQDQVAFVSIKPKVPGELEAKAQIANKKQERLDYSGDWTGTISVLLSDFVIVWRAWALFQQETRWRVALGVLMTINVGYLS
ncbi:hypothetical protein GYMLUDRAFT_248410 [Collybiopsis luxurians FD-317 M1]|uniref:Uncharacterized protein n=1 Tax=Collybiopsis luxurians FD-317 M1 TaxID=944289 RepID=A0A0D0CCL4_9AGAR|nr:hypothetical protein GYMLUDRAFT_248410 [Collybiopsis luxurians FD-317 M1]